MKIFFQILLTFFIHNTWAQNFSFNYDRTQSVNKNISDVTRNTFELNYITIDSISLDLKFVNDQYNFIVNGYDTQFLQKMNSFEFVAKKTFKLKNNWGLNFVFKPQLNTHDNKFTTFKNLYPNSQIGFLKEFKSKKSSLFLGIEYGNLLGEMSFYPIINFQKKMNNYIDLRIGFPETQIKIKCDDKNYLIFNSNFSTHFWNINQNVNSRISDTNQILSYEYLYSKQLNASFEYNYLFENLVVINFEIGKSFNNTLEIKEINKASTSFNLNNQFYVNMGIKYNFNL